MTLASAERPRLVPVLEDLALAIETLLAAGLTTASESTRQKLDVSFREASRLGLLRLGSTIRAANEEIGRFVAHAPEFSSRRLVFFLERAWILARGMARAIRAGDEAGLERLLLAPRMKPVERLEVVALGAGKKHVAGQYAAFEFRLRVVGGSDHVPAGQRLVWSCVFPVKPGVEVPPEAYLQLPQKQKFKPAVFLERSTVVLQGVQVALDAAGGGRVSLLEKSTVSPGTPFDRWDRFATWDPHAALERLRAHEPGPLDLDVELQEEVVLGSWKAGPATEGRPDAHVVAIASSGVDFDAILPPGPEGIRQSKLLAKARAPLFGLLHYERCRLVLTPLSALEPDGPQYLTISGEGTDPRELLKTLRFT